MKRPCKECMDETHKHRIISDDDGHWYVIRTNQSAEFQKYVDDNYTYMTMGGHNFEQDRLPGGPSSVVFGQFKVEE